MYFFDCGHQVLLGFHDGCDVHCSGVAIIGRLPHVHMVIWMHCFAPDLSAHYFDGPVSDHFIGVHVGLRAAASLPND